MPIPDFQTVMLPLLRLTGDGHEHSMKEARQVLGDEFDLDGDDLAELLPSGRQTVFANRVAWAKTYLTQAGLLGSPKRGIFKVTDRGREALDSVPAKIDIQFLEQYPEFVEFRNAGKKQSKADQNEPDHAATAATPEEVLEEAYRQLRNETASELLTLIKSNSPTFFEHLVVELLVRMGYGGSVKEAGQATRKTGDEGIDGIIKEDRLGLDTIYLQAKRWEGAIGRPEIQKFVGALHGQRAKKGVFITTSRFSTEAVDYAAHIDSKVVLIDGPDLVQMMIEHGLGVSSVATYEIKRVDTDYFVEE